MTPAAVRRRLAAALALVVLAVAVGACGDDHDAPASRRVVYRNLAANVISPLYERLDEATADLATATSALCADPSAANVDAARTAWEHAWQAWNRTKAFRFGPLTDSRAVADIGFMVDGHKVDTVVDGSNAAVGPPFTADSVAATGADVRGLAAIEHVLFQRDPTEPDTCAYAAAAASLVAEKAAMARAAWTEGTNGDPAYADLVAKPGNEAYGDSQAVLDDLVNGMAMALSEATKALADAESAPPDRRDTFGTHGGDHVRDTLWSVRASYEGSLRDGGGRGVGALVADASSDADARFRTNLERATRAARALPPDLERAKAALVDEAYRRFRALGTNTRAEVASILGVTLSLSDSDGDS